MSQLVEEHHQARAEETGPSGTRIKKASFIFYGLALTAIIAWEALQIFSPSGSIGKPVALSLSRGKFLVHDFRPEKLPPHAIILFGSGDGGWSAFEEYISRTLQERGYEVIGINFEAYAETDYNLGILQADFQVMAHRGLDAYGGHWPPLIVAGYSMGAAQAIAVAGGPHPPPGMVGLLLIDPCSRGRYGLRLADQSNILPRGAGTFAVADFAPAMHGIRVAQWHAVLDSIDSRAWLDLLTVPHKEFDFAAAGHSYGNDRGDFLAQLSDSIGWILQGNGSPGAVLEKEGAP